MTRTQKPLGKVLVDPPTAQREWMTFFETLASVANTVAGVARMRVHAVAALPSVIPEGQVIYVSDEIGGAVLAFSDGVNWRRATDRVIVA